MKTLLVATIIAAFSLVASVQADDKAPAKPKTASVTTSAEQAKTACAEKSGCCAEKTSCCAEKSVKKADVSVKGATLLVRR